MKIAKISDYNDNVLSISPDQAIQDFQQCLKENPRYDKVFLLALDNKGGEFEVVWFKGQMLSSDALAALNITMDDLRRALRGEKV